MGLFPLCRLDIVSPHTFMYHTYTGSSCGSGRGPLLNSYVIQNLSWQLGFWFVSVACGLSFLATFFFVPEVSCLCLS